MGSPASSQRGHVTSNLSAQEGADLAVGEATTDESDGEATQYATRRSEVLDTGRRVFADAAEEFGNLAAVKRRLER